MDDLFKRYACDEFLNPAYGEGLFDEQAQQWLLRPPNRAYERDDFLVIGSPGVDGIEWGFRKGERGIWSYEPIGQEFRFLAPSLAEFLEGWQSGTITV